MNSREILPVLIPGNVQRSGSLVYVANRNACIQGDVTFTQREANVLDFDDQDHTSPAVLYRCANGAAAAPSRP